MTVSGSKARSFLFILCAATGLTTQSQVSQDPQPRKVLLEEFTAVNCGNCPAGHAAAAAIADAYPDQTVVVNIHAGPLAVPSGSQPDFRTSWGTQLLNAHGVTFTPQGLVNRRTYNGSTLLSSGAWSNAAGAVRALPSPVNLAVAGILAADGSTVEVEVELFYTAASASGDDRLHVLLTEDHITGWQTNYGTDGNQPAYDHRHVLRSYLTPIGGEALASTGAGFADSRSFTASVSGAWNLANLQVVAFVTEGPGGPPSGEVYQVGQAPVTLSAGVEEATAMDALSIFPNPAEDRIVVHFEKPTRGWLRVLDGMGRELLREPIAPAQRAASLYTAHLPNGVYHVVLEGGGSRRMIIQR